MPTPLPPPPQSTTAPGTATVAVIVPAGGQVWFNDTLTPAKGDKWVFSSGRLEAGKTYVVNVKVRWSQNGQDQNYDIPLRVVAGDNMTMDLTRIR